MFEFSDSQKQKLQIFADLLRKENQKYNLTRITEYQEIWARHFQDSAACIEIFQKSNSEIGALKIIDIGSGAGFPGLVLATVIPDCNLLSVESTAKKCQFQKLVIKELGLNNAEVINSRAEDLARQPYYREKFDFAISRAVARLDILAEVSMAFLKIGGTFLAWKGPKVQEELDSGQKAINKLGGGKIETFLYKIQDQMESARIIMATKQNPTDPKYPRNYRDILQKSKKN